MSFMPKGWKSALLSDVAEIKGGLAKGKDRNGLALRSVPYLRVANVQQRYLDLSEILRIEATESEIRDLALERGDVLLNEGGDRDKLGRGWVWEGRIPLCIHQNHVFRARPRSDLVDPYYLSYWANTEQAQNYFIKTGKQTTNLASISKTNLSNLSVPLPPLPEQRRIAAILGQAEALRAKRRAALAKLDTIAQSIFIEMFGDPVTNPKGWTIIPLADFVTEVTNGLTRRRNDSVAGTDIVLRLRDIRSDWIDFSGVNRITLTSDESNRFQVSTNDLLFIRVNGNPDYVGRCALFRGFTEPVYFNDHIMRVRLDEAQVTGAFLCFVLNGTHGKKEIALHRKTSAGQHTINQEGLRRIRIPVPTLSLQYEFERRVAATLRLKASHRIDLNHLDALFASLQHLAFRGEL